MYFANPWGLLALLALPAIAVIHLYHRRFPPLVVAGAHLWGVETEVRSAGRRRDRLPITATLLLELTAALLLGLLLGQPRIGALGTATHLVVVLDNSASMQSHAEGQPSLRDRAIAELDRRMAELSRGSVVTVLLTGRRPAMLAGPAVPWSEAKPLLAAWQPSAPRHEFQPAWDRAAQFAENTGRLLFLTDALPPDDAPLPKGMEVVALGRPLDNVALTAARWTFDSSQGKGRVFLRVENFGRRDADVTVTGTAKGQTVFERTVRLDIGEGVPLESDVAGGLGQLTVTLRVAGDALPVDNVVTLIEPKARLVTVANTLPDGAAARLTRRVLEHIPDWQPGDVSAAHLHIGPAGELPPSRPDLWWLGVGPLDLSEAAQMAAIDLAGPYLIEKQHPLLAGITLGGVIWGGVQPLDRDVLPLISAGRYPLLSQLNGTQTTGYLLNIDLSRSNLADSPDWPVLLSNLVELRREDLPGLRRWNYRLNEEIRFRLADAAAGTGELQLLHDGTSRPLARARLVELPPLSETGIYEIRDGGQSLGRFAVNFFDPAESTLTNLRTGHRAPIIADPHAAFRLDSPYSWLILLGLAAILAAVLLDWRVLRPEARMRK